MENVNKVVCLCLLISGLLFGPLKANQPGKDKAELERQTASQKKMKLSIRNPFRMNRMHGGGAGASFVGISVGSRFFANIPDGLYFSNGTDSEPVDVGQGKPALAALSFMILPEESGLAGTVALEGFLGTTSGFMFNFGAGYKLGSYRFSFTPLLSFGLGRISSYLQTVKLGSGVLPGGLFESGSTVVFVGPDADNGGRGGGGDIGYRMNSAMFSFKPSANISVRAADRLVIFADVGFNVVFAKTENEFKLSGMGYSDAKEAGQSGLAPHSVSVKTKNPGQLRDAAGNTYTKNPINPSGLQFSIGVGFPMN